MPKKLEDDELIRLTLESEEISNRLNELHGQKAEHESVLAQLDETQREILGRIHDITEQLNRASGEIRSLTDERRDRTYYLRDLARRIERTAKDLHTVRRTIMDSVGRDVCPQCGSTEIATISYGYPVEEPDDDPYEPDHVMGGCCVNLDETGSCQDCGKSFLGNFERLRRRCKSETVLEVGAEGGSLAILRQWNQNGAWDYWSSQDERTMLDLLPEDEIGNRDDLFQKSSRVGNFEDALLRLDKYRWFALYPLKVSEEFYNVVLREVEKRDGKEAVIEWTERLRQSSI